jgi:hypothetical protein
MVYNITIQTSNYPGAKDGCCDEAVLMHTTACQGHTSLYRHCAAGTTGRSVAANIRRCSTVPSLTPIEHA